MKQNIFFLENEIKYYSWGSVEGIPSIIGISNEKLKPMAEFWMGSHPEGSSTLYINKNKKKLVQLIEHNPKYYLGTEIAKTYNNKLPFLFKILSAEQPLSLQVHPTKKQAESGFNNPNTQIKLNYKDENHKPEIVLALTKFKAMCGFRSFEETKQILTELDVPEILKIISIFKDNNNYKQFLQSLLEIPKSVQKNICSQIYEQANVILQSTKNNLVSTAFSFVLAIYQHYPKDIGILAPLFLNCLELSPGQAIYLPAGIMHAYIHGTALELMANSDNVLRAGLTQKHIDIKELLHVLNDIPYVPNILTNSSALDCYMYKTPFKEFELTAINTLAEPIVIKITGPSIVLCTKEYVYLTIDEERVKCSKGKSAFIPAHNKNIHIEGKGTLFIAHVGENKISIL